MIAFCLTFIEARCATGGRNTCVPGFPGKPPRSLIYNVLSDGREIPPDSSLFIGRSQFHT